MGSAESVQILSSYQQVYHDVIQASKYCHVEKC